MADIDIQRKTTNAVWWIVGVIALFLFIWLLFASDTEPTATRVPGRSTPTAALSPDVFAPPLATASHRMASRAAMVS